VASNRPRSFDCIQLTRHRAVPFNHGIQRILKITEVASCTLTSQLGASQAAEKSAMQHA
jgi:hypothetical protein